MSKLGWILGRGATAPLVAAGFLTIIPIPVPRAFALGPMGWPIACFPIVGAAIGGVVAAAGHLLSLWYSPSLVAALMMAVSLGVTGALHLDGLMDSFDGLFGGKDPAARLAIMRDSRVGSYGVAAGIAFLLVEYGALTSLAESGQLLAMVLAATLARWAMVVTLWIFPAASAGGLAAGLKPVAGWQNGAAATLIAVAIAVGLFGWIGVVVVATSGLLVGLGGRLVVARLGGITGDNCGGIGLLAEVTALLVCVAALS